MAAAPLMQALYFHCEGREMEFIASSPFLLLLCAKSDRKAHPVSLRP
jgi:hypothetical protein